MTVYLRICVLGASAVLPTGTYLTATFYQARSAGYLSGTLTWGLHESNCLRRHSGLDRAAAQKIVADLEHYRAWWPEAFTQASVRAQHRFESIDKSVGHSATCTIYFEPLRDELVYTRALKVGLWWMAANPSIDPTVLEPVKPFPPSVPPVVAKQKAELSSTDDRDASDRFLQSLADDLNRPEFDKFRHGIVYRRMGYGDAPLRIVTQPGSNYFFKLVRPNTRIIELAGFIEGGKILDAQLTIGDYELRYAVGQSWISAQEFFGVTTGFSKASSPLSFKFDGARYQGVEVRLIMQTGGNLKTTAVKRSEF
jgi:hypothetical protein